MTSRGKIRFALLAVAFIALGTTLLSLSYMNQMARRIDQIASKDAKIAELGEALSIQMLQARREEKNFIIYLDTLYISNTHHIIKEMRSSVLNAKEIAQNYVGKLDSIEALLQIYDSDITNLVYAFQEDPRTLYNLQRQIMNYEQELRTLAKNRRLDLESLPSWSSDASIALLSAGAKLSTEKSRLFEELRDVGNDIMTLAQQITTLARKSLATNSAQGISYSVKAQRNTITLILIAIFLIAYLIIYLPNNIFQPYRKIGKALLAIGRGESEFLLPNMEVKDELGDFSRAIKEAIQKLHAYNDLKTIKIAQIQRNLHRILEEVKEAVIILAPDLTILFLNSAAKYLFETDRELISKSIKELEPLWNVLDRSIIDIEKKGRYEVEFKLKKVEFKKKVVSIVPSTGSAGRLENILIIIK